MILFTNRLVFKKRNRFKKLEVEWNFFPTVLYGPALVSSSLKHTVEKPPENNRCGGYYIQSIDEFNAQGRVPGIWAYFKSMKDFEEFYESAEKLSQRFFDLKFRTREGKRIIIVKA